MTDKAFDRDPRGKTILGGTSIVNIYNKALTDDVWELIKIPVGVHCKQMEISERSQGIIKISLVPGGTPFFSVSAPLGLEISGKNNQDLFYAQMGFKSGVLEILFID